MIPTPEMIEAARKAYVTELPETALYPSEFAMRAALTAALALIPGEAVAVWRKFENGNNYLDIRDKELFASSNEIELFASTPAPLPVAVKVKPLEWEKGKQSNWTVWRAKGLGVTYECAAKVYNEGWMWGTREGDTNFDAADENEAKAAAQRHFEDAIRSALSSPVGGMEEEPKSPVEPYGYAFQHEETGLTQVVDVQQVEWGFEKNNPRWQKVGAVYLHAPISSGELEDYDAGLLNDFGGGNVEWWHDYLRAEIGRANDFWREQVDSLQSSPTLASDISALREETIEAAMKVGLKAFYDYRGNESAVGVGIRAGIAAYSVDFDRVLRETIPTELLKLTFAVQHNPNCPAPWLVRLPGPSGLIDMKPYADQLGLVAHQTGDILGFGRTLEDAAGSALQHVAKGERG